MKCSTSTNILSEHSKLKTKLKLNLITYSILSVTNSLNHYLHFTFIRVQGHLIPLYKVIHNLRTTLNNCTLIQREEQRQNHLVRRRKVTLKIIWTIIKHQEIQEERSSYPNLMMQVTCSVRPMSNTNLMIRLPLPLQMLQMKSMIGRMTKSTKCKPKNNILVIVYNPSPRKSNTRFQLRLDRQ